MHMASSLPGIIHWSLGSPEQKERASPNTYFSSLYLHHICHCSVVQSKSCGQARSLWRLPQGCVPEDKLVRPVLQTICHINGPVSLWFQGILYIVSSSFKCIRNFNNGLKWYISSFLMRWTLRPLS